MRRSAGSARRSRARARARGRVPRGRWPSRPLPSPRRARRAAGATSRAAEPPRRRGGRRRRRPPRPAGSSWAASAAAVAGSAPPWIRTASVRSAIRGATSSSTSSGAHADLLEPESVLLDEVEGQPVGARRTRRGDRELELDLLSRCDRVRQRCPRAVPDDRVAERVEPVEGRLDAVRSVRAPGRRAGVLERRRGPPRRRRCAVDRATTRASGARAAQP